MGFPDVVAGKTKARGAHGSPGFMQLVVMGGLEPSTYGL
jgi:hypothetical protein